jgi:phosphopantetheinyl transferase
LTKSSVHHTPPDRILRTSDEYHVDVWTAVLDVPASALEALERILSNGERARAERFYAPIDRNRYVASHIVLRMILSSYIGDSPGKLLFSYGPYGQPSLTGPTRVRFSLSHAEDLAFIAVTYDRAIGIDVEHLNQADIGRELGERFLSSGQLKRLTRLPRSMRRREFLLSWTFREAYAKARGIGLFDFEAPMSFDPARWTALHLTLGPRFVGTIVGEGLGWHLRLRPCMGPFKPLPPECWPARTNQRHPDI